MSATLCSACPRRCAAPRTPGTAAGFCQSPLNPVVARAALHFGEEPPISGTRGSGTVFFAGCSLRCVFCQNGAISREGRGNRISPARLREIFFELIGQGAHNINLVTAAHYAAALQEALREPLPVPVVYNSGGYERIKTLRAFEGRIQGYLPDLKYSDNALAARLSGAPDYFETATAAILEMFRQTGPYELDDDGILRRGVIIRHLVLPNHIDNTLGVLDWVTDTFREGDVMLSLMSQYTPCGDLSAHPDIARPLTQDEYDAVCGYLDLLGWEDGFVQDLSSEGTDAIPAFDGTGV